MPSNGPRRCREDRSGSWLIQWTPETFRRLFRGFRTLFNSFHHFTPDDARAILRGAVGARQPIAVFEIPERKLSVVLSTLLAPFMVLLATPFIRP